MNTDSPRKTNYLRRSLGILLGAAPFVLCLASAAYGFTHSVSSPWRGIAVALGASGIGALNFYLSFLRPAVYQFIHRTRDGYRHVSGFPIIGTILLAVAVIYGFGSVGTAAVAFSVLCIDTGGEPWFIYSTWRDQSLWDA